MGERGFLLGRGDPDLERDFEGFLGLGFFSRLWLRLFSTPALNDDRLSSFLSLSFSFSFCLFSLSLDLDREEEEDEEEDEEREDELLLDELSELADDPDELLDELLLELLSLLEDFFRGFFSLSRDFLSFSVPLEEAERLRLLLRTPLYFNACCLLASNIGEVSSS